MTGTRIRALMRKPLKREASIPARAQRESNHAAALQPRACPQLAHGGRRDERDRLPGAICGEELRDGHEVHIEGLGYFAPTLEATQKVTRSTPNKHLKLRLKSISFRPDVRLKQAMTGVNAIRSKYTRHSLKLSEVEIDMKLKEYFADHDVLIRSDFQALCGMARTTANVHLKRLQQEGKLKNVGKPTQPIYRAMPGYYGVSRDAKAGR